MARSRGAAARASVLVESACPLVTKVHHELAARARDGYDIVYVGGRCTTWPQPSTP